MGVKQIQITPFSFMRNLKIIYFLILAGMLIFGLIILYVSDSWDITMPGTDDSFLIAVPLFTFLGVVLGRVLYKRKLDNVLEEESLKSKLKGFEIALIIKFMFVEAPFILGVIATISTNNIFYLMISGTLVMYFLTLKPSKNKVIKDLNLNKQMILEFNNSKQEL